MSKKFVKMSNLRKIKYKKTIKECFCYKPTGEGNCPRFQLISANGHIFIHIWISYRWPAIWCRINVFALKLVITKGPHVFSVVLVEVFKLVEEINRSIHFAGDLKRDRAINFRSAAIRCYVVIAKPHLLHTCVGIKENAAENQVKNDWKNNKVV